MKVIFDFAKNQVTIEGDSTDMLSVLKDVQALAPKLSRIELITSQANMATGQLADGVVQKPAAAERLPNKAGVGLREFARSISPANNYEKIAVIAVYKARFESVETFSPKEMGEWFVMCGFERPSQMPVAMFDAKRKYGYLDKAGHGQWKLSNEGLNLVTRRQEGTGGGQ